MFPVYINTDDHNYVIESSIDYKKLPNACRTDMVLERDFDSNAENVTYSECDGKTFLHYEYGTRVIEAPDSGKNTESGEVYRHWTTEYFLRLINLNSKTLIQLI